MTIPFIEPRRRAGDYVPREAVLAPLVKELRLDSVDAALLRRLLAEKHGPAKAETWLRVAAGKVIE